MSTKTRSRAQVDDAAPAVDLLVEAPVGDGLTGAGFFDLVKKWLKTASRLTSIATTALSGASSFLRTRSILMFTCPTPKNSAHEKTAGNEKNGLLPF